MTTIYGINFIMTIPRTQLSKCMAEFMSGKVEFNKLSRLERISCSRTLRNIMEVRMNWLLRTELENSLDEISGADLVRIGEK